MLSFATKSIAVSFLKSACLSAESVIIVIAQISGIYESNAGEHMANFPASTKVSVISPNTFDKDHTYNLCEPFNPDLRCASLCGVEFVFKKERREKEGATEVRIQRVIEITNLSL